MTRLKHTIGLAHRLMMCININKFHYYLCTLWSFRKKALLFNNIVAIVAAVLMLFSRKAKSFEMILLGRFLYGYNVGMLWCCSHLQVPFRLLSESFSFLYFFLLGGLTSSCLSLSTGLGLSVHLMYLGESSPKQLRGFLTLTTSIFIGFGKIAGQIIGIK